MRKRSPWCSYTTAHATPSLSVASQPPGVSSMVFWISTSTTTWSISGSSRRFHAQAQLGQLHALRRLDERPQGLLPRAVSFDDLAELLHVVAADETGLGLRVPAGGVTQFVIDQRDA